MVCHWLTAVLMAVLLSGCLPFTNMPGTVKSSLTLPTFQEENQPVRQVSVMVLTDGSFGDETIQATLMEASDRFKEMTGIEIEKVYMKFVPKWNGIVTDRDLLIFMKKENQEQNLDLVMAFTNRLFPSDVLLLIGVYWMGKIDDTYRRYIVIRTPTVHTVMHEMAHAFILEKGHGTCLMMSGMFIAPWCKYLGEEDRKEFLKNKWRDFNEKVHVEQGTDYLPET